MSSASSLTIGSALLTWVLLFPTRAWLLSRRIIDCPNERSSHDKPTVRGAGIVVVLVLTLALAAMATSHRALLLFGTAFAGLALVSFSDDVRGVRPIFRLVVQGGVAVLALVAARFLSPGSGGIAAEMLWWPMAALWLAGYTNAFNFMDGINGLAAAQAVATGAGTALIARRLGIAPDHPTVVLSWLVTGAALGFLPHNFPRAHAFMGDVCSATLGFMLAFLAIWIALLTHAWVLLWVGLLHTNFVLDTAVTLWRRSRQPVGLFDSHRDHFYQRLIRAGKSHSYVTGLEMALQLVTVAVLWGASPCGWAAKAGACGGIILLWAGFLAYAENTFRRGQQRKPKSWRTTERRPDCDPHAESN